MTGGLGLFGRKKKSKLFGNDIEPCCKYCGNYSEGKSTCGLGLELNAGKCGGFVYDPLKRTPDSPPPLKQYDPDEFKL